MKKQFAKTSLGIMIALLAIGFVLIFSSGTIGQNMGDSALQANGGSMDTSSYQRIIDTTTENFRVVGFILSAIGGFGFILSGYALYKEL